MTTNILKISLKQVRIGSELPATKVSLLNLTLSTSQNL